MGEVVTLQFSVELVHASAGKSGVRLQLKGKSHDQTGTPKPRFSHAQAISLTSRNVYVRLWSSRNFDIREVQSWQESEARKVRNGDLWLDQQWSELGNDYGA